jgi:predicted secreted protein
MSNAQSGIGVQFLRETTHSGGNFSAIAEVLTISFSLSRTTIDVTNLDSLSGYKEFITGFREGGEITMGMNFSYSGFADLKDDFEDDTELNYQIKVPGTNACTFEFAGRITKIGFNADKDNAIRADITVIISGFVDLGT